ncbi:MAG TPA: hypothetical protein VF861_14515 [Telluria sp.]
MEPITIALGLASQFAPSIIKYFSKSDTAAAVATQVIDIAKTVSGKGTTEEAVSAISADPALAAQFQLAVMANEANLEQAHLVDVQSARMRDIELAKAGIRNYRANIMAAAALLLVIICLMIVVWSTDSNEFTKATISLILGRALGWVEQLFSFEFGTTRASKTKDDTISKLTGA